MTTRIGVYMGTDELRQARRSVRRKKRISAGVTLAALMAVVLCAIQILRCS
jgi:Na+-driven multidrug efflux pump